MEEFPAHTLVVVWVQPQHFPIGVRRGLDVADFMLRSRELMEETHEIARLHMPPEPVILAYGSDEFGVEFPPACDSLVEQVDGFLSGLREFEEDEPRAHAILTDGQGFFRGLFHGGIGCVLRQVPDDVVGTVEVGLRRAAESGDDVFHFPSL